VRISIRHLGWGSCKWRFSLSADSTVVLRREEERREEILFITELQKGCANEE